jgi:pyrroloquinoline-quinone synthase
VTIIDARSLLDDAADQRRLLNHPFYHAWQAGELTRNDLAHYAAQYRHVEQVLPTALEVTVAKLPAGQPRRLVESNLADETARPQSHLDLFDIFTIAVGADNTASPSPSTTQLVVTYLEAAQEGPLAALAVIGAYEVQAAEVATTKAASLRYHYNLDAHETEFWDVHAQLEDAHANWTAEAIAALAPSHADVSRYAKKSAAAWWAFLDERQAVRQI